MSIFDGNKYKVKRLKKTAMKIESLKEEYSKLSNEQLVAKTQEFKERYKNGESLNSLLVEAFATVREASKRILNMEHFFVQLMGGIAIHQGRIAEMGTGEGKTLVATLPVYLNAIAGDGVHVVTVNDYLAARDAAWMGKLYKFLGLTVGVIVSTTKQEDKKEMYNCDITYCTNSQLGFDFLIDNMATEKEEKNIRGLNFAIIDEIDSILIDEARTPLIISGQGEKSSNIYKVADAFAKSTKPEDFVIDEKDKTIMLTDEGIAKAENFFKVDNLTDIENTTLYHHIQQALRARHMMKRDKDYIVSEGEVLIVDEFTGRVMVGRRYSDGLHQAIEAKEKVQIRAENRTMATITFQNLFRMYKKLSGMTGTAKTEEDEFKTIYSLDVVIIPPNKPSQRRDEVDSIYYSEEGKIKSVIEDIQSCHEKGQPVLVGTVSVERSEEYSRKLNRVGIPHVVLNAKNHKEESSIVAQAGREGAVTIATNMAGRGTDIMLGGNADYKAKQQLEKDGFDLDTIEMATSPYEYTDERVKKAKEEYQRLYSDFKKECDEEKSRVIEAGGLRIIGTERHESRRIDNQLRGRAGRQGDVGSTKFYISLDDDVARIFGGERIKRIMEVLNLVPAEGEDEIPITNKMVAKQIERAQKMSEGQNYSIRKQVLSYDDVMNVQREIIYKERNQVLEGINVHEQVLKMIDDLAHYVVGLHANYKVDYQKWDYEEFNRALEISLLPNGTNYMTEDIASCYDVKKLGKLVSTKTVELYEEKIAKAKELDFDFSDIERTVLLNVVDRQWIDHIDVASELKNGIFLRGYGQRDPLIEFQREAWGLFEDMSERIHRETASVLLKLEVYKNEDGEVVVGREAAASAEKSKMEKVGRNDPCPCGSGKKYKNCCGKNS